MPKGAVLGRARHVQVSRPFSQSLQFSFVLTNTWQLMTLIKVDTAANKEKNAETRHKNLKMPDEGCKK